MDKQHPVNDLIGTTMEKIRTLVDSNTIIGQPIQTGDVTLIPVSKLSVGIAGGGSDFVTKNHSFFDGNKRIAATMFLYFLDKNQALFVDGKKKIADATLVALTIMIAESRPDEKEMMISVIMNCMQ